MVQDELLVSMVGQGPCERQARRCLHRASSADHERDLTTARLGDGMQQVRRYYRQVALFPLSGEITATVLLRID
jgi:hypothetical protein